MAPNRLRSSAFGLAAVAGAGAVGVLSAFNPVLAVAAIGAAVAVPAAVLRPRLIAYLLVASIFAEVVTIGGVAIGRVAVPLGLIAAISQYLDAPTRLREAGLTAGVVLGYASLAVASVAWTVSPSTTLVALGSLVLAIAAAVAFAVLIREPEHLRRLFWVVTICSVLLGLWWIFSYTNGVDRFENQAGDPNFLASFQVVALPMVLVLAASARTTGGRTLLYAACATIAGSIVATLSRGGVVTLLVTLGIIAVMPAPALFGTKVRKAAFFGTAGIALAVFLILAGGSLNQRIESATQQGTLIGSRADLWRGAIQGYKEHPVVGLGFGGFKATSFGLLSRTPGVNLSYHQDFRLRSGEYVHNAYLGSLAELGPLGLLLFVGIYLAVARSLIRTAGRAKMADDPFIRSVANALLVGLLAFGVASMSLSSETSRALWMIVGLSLTLPGMVREPQPEEEVVLDATPSGAAT